MPFLENIRITQLRTNHRSFSKSTLFVLIWISYMQPFALSSWEEWWTYSGISGPDFWGLLNPDWHLCSRGRSQSPIDLDPDQLLFHPYLKPFVLESAKISANITNTGHDVVIRLLSGGGGSNVNLTGGPLQYSYVISQLRIHHGVDDHSGSEHFIQRKPFPAELQLIGYNSDLYSNYTEALEAKQSGALVAIAVLIQIGNASHTEFRAISSQLNKIIHRDQTAQIEKLDVSRLIPSTEEYMTYMGSLTQPGCIEGVRWLVMNKAMQVSKQQINSFRKLMQGDIFNPKAPLSNNARPLQPLNNRVIYTNIDFKRRTEEGRCPSMQKNMHYKINSGHQANDLD